MKKLLKRLFSFLCIAIVSLWILGIAAKHIAPDSAPQLSLFSLITPYALLALVGALLLALATKLKFLSIVLAIALGLGINTASDIFQINLSTGSGNGSLKVMSYNVRQFGLYQGKKGFNMRDGIFKLLQQEDCDIMCFQEFYHRTPPAPFVTRDSLVTVIDAPYIHEKYTHHFVYDQYFGVVTMSRYPIVNKGEVPFIGATENFCFYSDIVLASNDTIRVFNGHLASIHLRQDDYLAVQGKLGDKQSYLSQGKVISNKLSKAFTMRQKQVELILAAADESPYPVIFCVDLNDTPSSYCYGLINAQFHDSFQSAGFGFGSTHNGFAPFLHIDHIFHSDGLETKGFRKLDLAHSDHYPIIADFDLNQ